MRSYLGTSASLPYSIALAHTSVKCFNNIMTCDMSTDSTWLMEILESRNMLIMSIVSHVGTFIAINVIVIENVVLPATRVKYLQSFQYYKSNQL